eukprot:TRINITY_DN44_c0_g1_i6.p1 TRINITY_DN44_c0_g1~~TRINITY_DN44_c0_g1_i6.p1  ORF type:complete len:366 (-),score=60.48 TRINITY_DN44_c0_g1_i6:45-1142(-)
MSVMRTFALLLGAFTCHGGVFIAAATEHSGKHHHGKHHHKRSHHHHHHATDGSVSVKISPNGVHQSTGRHETGRTQFVVNTNNKSSATNASTEVPSANVSKVLTVGEMATTTFRPDAHGRLLMNGPLPEDFEERFRQAVAKAVGCNTSAVKVVGVEEQDSHGASVIVDFTGPADVVIAVENQSACPDSNLNNGPMRPFLVAGETVAEYNAAVSESHVEPPQPAGLDLISTEQEANQAIGTPEATQAEKGDGAIDVDTAMPYGELEPFGREDTAQELTEQSISESDEMVDQLELAEVAEEKRAVFRALTRLRGAAITSFDGVARSQTGNIDEYNKVHKWRSTHPLRHLASEEADVSKWAFPDNADF